ncbi:hypothetical protein PZN02_005435 [Sinorhizobium garamanticum]|uniref:PGG domain-containing protein n=1 Tax=Sinorhizobium garamanticum TaxID=680247 RepID=A0ABY8DIQ2_9HYPH|nr:hypothetical protein [Sinorhizobium garamanticum]WEX90082.1 hypothetical protein PZN02_005435 [Sinorhizobium garamanticum]
MEEPKTDAASAFIALRIEDSYARAAKSKRDQEQREQVKKRTVIFAAITIALALAQLIATSAIPFGWRP